MTAIYFDIRTSVHYFCKRFFKVLTPCARLFARARVSLLERGNEETLIEQTMNGEW